MENRKVKHFLSWGWYLWEGEGCKERKSEGECDGNIMYSGTKMEK
jgi:hypothetical protein